MINPKVKWRKTWEEQRAEEAARKEQEEARKKQQQREWEREERRYAARRAEEHERENEHFSKELNVLKVAAATQEMLAFGSAIGAGVTFAFATIVDIGVHGYTHVPMISFFCFIALFLILPLYCAANSAQNNPEPLPESVHKNYHTLNHLYPTFVIIDSIEDWSGEHIRICEFGKNAPAPITWESSIKGMKEAITYRKWVVRISLLWGIFNFFALFVFFL